MKLNTFFLLQLIERSLQTSKIFTLNQHYETKSVNPDGSIVTVTVNTKKNPTFEQVVINGSPDGKISFWKKGSEQITFNGNGEITVDGKEFKRQITGGDLKYQEK